MTPHPQAAPDQNELFIREVVGKRNFAALDDVYTADARILPTGAPMVSGRDAIKKFWSDFIPSVNATGGALTSVEVTQAGDGLVEIGRATLSMQPEGQGASQLEVARRYMERERLGL